MGHGAGALFRVADTQACPSVLYRSSVLFLSFRRSHVVCPGPGFSPRDVCVSVTHVTVALTAARNVLSSSASSVLRHVGPFAVSSDFCGRPWLVCTQRAALPLQRVPGSCSRAPCCILGSHCGPTDGATLAISCLTLWEVPVRVSPVPLHPREVFTLSAGAGSPRSIPLPVGSRPSHWPGGSWVWVVRAPHTPPTPLPRSPLTLRECHAG